MRKHSTSWKAFTVATLCALGATSAFAASAEMPDNQYWWPNRLSLEPLRDSSPSADPMGGNFNYNDALKNLDVEALKKDLSELMTTSQDWWPADYGHYGPFFIRMSWHAAGTYRTIDGRGGADGGMQRFAPLNAWPDNANLDKARRLLLPIKQKYGNALSWADLLVLAGTVAMEDMGFKISGFAFGRADEWEPEAVNWGPEGQWLTDERRDKDGNLKGPFGATEMGLIYVNPEGPHGNPDPLAAARDIRQAFGRMGMNDEETAALIAGGHTFGKTHGAHKPADCVGADPEAAALEQQGLGWHNKCGKGNAGDTVTSGLEGAWTISPAEWTHNFLQNLYGFEWELTTSPAGAKQWIPKDGKGADMVPDAHDPQKRHAPIMLTTDLALKRDPAYRKITQKWLKNPAEFEQAYARAWFKLTHRDMGPVSRYQGPWLPKEQYIWQDPVPAADYQHISTKDVAQLKKAILDSGLSTAQLVRTAWASAATFRATDMRGGANGARIRLAPQKDWAVNNPKELAKVLGTLEKIQKKFNKKAGKTQVSMADLIVLGGAAAIEKAAADAGYNVKVPFVAGRTDASQNMTDVQSFALLEPKADGFRNYLAAGYPRPPAEALVERAALLDLTVPEMTALIGGMRVLGANADGSKHGVFTETPGQLNNAFFVNLVDMSTQWKKSKTQGLYEGHDRTSGKVKWTATPVDLVFGSNSELRAIAEFYASDDAKQKFVDDFVLAWTKVMTADRFDVK
ncbi:MAG: catalase/peroxidase HPI [Pseudomonadales bacterium]|nr:catalase/peroxidase HPI [Pseudomonadales bacterium]MBI26118.1 catalase/peroxidase HPI [Pseudomonadales bacterium]HAG92985.1 catalase/peroxidase HPI [Gammaproteobacteria bacterium]HBO93554.1 catalase/peroxidase HPI [Gammaproteobacteria bacterium]